MSMRELGAQKAGVSFVGCALCLSLSPSASPFLSPTPTQSTAKVAGFAHSNNALESEVTVEKILGAMNVRWSPVRFPIP